MPNQRSDRMTTMTVTLPRDLLDSVRALADRRLTTRSALLRQAVSEFLEREARHDSHSEH